jgi:hypothetical protein
MIENLYKLFLDEIEFFKKNSHFTHSRAKSISDTGDLTEFAIRKFLREIIGNRFRITHGYIYSSENQKLSKQIDVIITDTLVPHSLKKFEYLDGLEIVPKESVVGIFEIKRTLKQKTLKEAIEHLDNIIKGVPIAKDSTNRYLHGGIQLLPPINGGKFANPIIGIISLENISSEKFEKIEIPNFIDMIFSFDGYFRNISGSPDPNIMKVVPQRDATYSYQWSVADVKRSQWTQEKILMAFVAYLIIYLNEVSGYSFDVNQYFFPKKDLI